MLFRSSSLGFYPVCPGSTDYAIGSPGVVSATIHLENGQTLEIQTEGQSETAVLVDQVFWNGEEIKDWTLNHLDLMQGGTLLYKMKE